MNTETNSNAGSGCSAATCSPIECPLDSISTAIAFTPHDWSTHHRMAWIYGIACGWDEESLAELTEKHGWKPETVERLKRLRAKWESLEANDLGLARRALDSK
jgi:hypothetical protein